MIEIFLFSFKSILVAEGFKVEAFADPNEAFEPFMQDKRMHLTITWLLRI